MARIALINADAQLPTVLEERIISAIMSSIYRRETNKEHLYADQSVRAAIRDSDFTCS